MIYPSFGAEERRGEEMGRRLIRSLLEFTCQEANAEERERHEKPIVLHRSSFEWRGAFQLGAAWYNNDAASLFFFFPPRDPNESRGKGEGGGIFPGLRRSKSKDSRRVNSRESGILEKVERERVFISTLPFSIFLTFSRSKIKTRWQKIGSH